jgi:transposase-like protein
MAASTLGCASPNIYINYIVEQDHQAVKRIINPMLVFKSFWRARIIIVGIDVYGLAY